MELTTDILKNKLNNEINDGIILDIKELNLNQCTLTMSNGKFLAMTKSNKWLIPMANFVNALFYVNSHSDLPHALLFAFYLSAYHNEIFYTRCTKFDDKILYYANSIVAHISSIIINNVTNYSEFLDTVDHYYSLYKLWVSKDEIHNISTKLINFKNTIETYDIINKINKSSSSNSKIITTLKEHMDDIFSINKMIAIKTFLQYYTQFCKIDPIKILFWNHVSCIYDDNTDHVFILLVAELRKYLIQNVSTIEAKKQLYYNIDIDELIKQTRWSKIKNDEYIKIVNILNDYSNKGKNSNDSDNYNHINLSYNVTDDILKKIITMYDLL